MTDLLPFRDDLHEPEQDPEPAAGPDPNGPWQRWRATYAKLPPPLQMIGLQLWLPFVFAIAYCLCYVAAFHAPTPTHVPAAIVGTGPQVTGFARQLEASSHGVLTVTTVGSVADATARVRDGSLAAAYVPPHGDQPAELIQASGAGYQLAILSDEVFAGVASAQNTTLRQVDVAPLPHHDAFGTTAFYVSLVWTITAYMTGMFVGMMGGPLKHRQRLSVIAGFGLVWSLLTAVLSGPVLGAIHGHFLAVWGIGWAATVAVGLVVNGLGYFFARFVTAAALLLFVFLNIQASGGAYPPEFVPGFFRAIHPFVIGSGLTGLLRRLLYGVGPSYAHSWAVVGGYALVGVVLTLVGKQYHVWRMARRARRGTPPGMLVAAQMSLMEPLYGDRLAPTPQLLAADVEAAPSPDDEVYAEEWADDETAYQPVPVRDRPHHPRRDTADERQERCDEVAESAAAGADGGASALGAEAP